MNEIDYVFPHCARKESEIKRIKGISRLFAYPGKPHYENEGKVVILDSGAHGLSISGGRINIKYMRELSRHYKKYSKEIERTICIAPDIKLDPLGSMWNLKKWHDNNLYPHVTAVIQRESKMDMDISKFKSQVDFYSNFTDSIAFACTGLKGYMARGCNLQGLFRYAKEEKGIKYIHVLGAGWDIKDIKDWKEIKYYDSIDSTMYYQPENLKERFGSDNPVENIKTICEVLDIEYKETD